MGGIDWDGPLQVAHEAARAWLEGIAQRPIRPERDLDQLLVDLDGPVPQGPTDAATVVAELAAAAEPGLLASVSPRFHGWVMGGITPAGLAADWLVSAWDQNAGMAGPTPAVAAVEAVTARWILQLLGLPEACSVGFVTGGTMANAVCMAAARGAVSRAHGWDVDAKGLVGGPAVRVVGGEHAHGSVGEAMRLLGLGRDRMVRVAADDNGRMDPDALETVMAGLEGPVIVVTQAGEVHTGGIDPFAAIGEVVAAARAAGPPAGVWWHVDGAIGLWALASDRLRPSFAGIELADSWSMDAHKWLNVPYDSGVAITAHPEAHHGAMATTGDYLPSGDGRRTPMDWTPEMSRRARGFAVHATIRSLGRSGIVELVERTHDMARRYARHLAGVDGVEVLNDVELNQVCVRFRDHDGEADRHTAAVLAAVQQDGIAYPSGGVWQGEQAMRISVSNWATDVDDVDRTVTALVQAHHRLRERPGHAVGHPDHPDQDHT